MQISDWRGRFDEYELHKASVADAAAIAPLVTERDEAADSLAAIGNAWSRAMFGGLFYLSNPSSADLPATNLVFVQSRDGNTVASDPASFGGGEADKHLIYEGLSRVAADAVLAGSRTISDGHVVLLGVAARARGAAGGDVACRGIRRKSSRRSTASISRAG